MRAWVVEGLRYEGKNGRLDQQRRKQLRKYSPPGVRSSPLHGRTDGDRSGKEPANEANTR